MKRSYSLLYPALVILALFSLPVLGIVEVPKMTSLAPETGKPGDLVTVEGEYIGKTHVAELYLTNGSTDWKCDIVGQTDTNIQFKIPAKVPNGRYALMVLTTTKPPKLIEEPVKVSVE